MYKVKVAVVGPSQAGKTMISNFLADATDNIGGDTIMFKRYSHCICNSCKLSLTS